MKFGTAIFTFVLLALFPTAFADDYLNSLEIVDPTWELELTPGGETVTVRGTVQEAVAHMVELNPDWRKQFNMTEEDFARQELELEQRDDDDDDEFSFRRSPRDFSVWQRSPLEMRTDWENDRDGKPGYCCACNDRWRRVGRNQLLDGIHYLSRVGGRPTLPAGPGKCERVSCSYDAAIIWCNDNRYTKRLQSYDSIGQGARFIYNKCREPINKSRGQIFHKTKWNVIVHRNSC